jgi:hypothetical protein
MFLKYSVIIKKIFHYTSSEIHVDALLDDDDDMSVRSETP